MNWDKLREEASEPDSLAKIIDSIEGAILPMMKAMLPEPTEKQLKLIYEEMRDLRMRLVKMWENFYGDDKSTQ